MLHYIYSRSLIGVLVAMPLLLAVWGALSARVAERQWRAARSGWRGSASN